MHLHVLFWCLSGLFPASCGRSPVPEVHVLEKKYVFALSEEKPVVKSLPADTSYLELIFKTGDLVDVNTLDSSILVDLRYSDTNNFMHRGFYDGLKKAYFTCEMALKLCNAQTFLREADSTLSLIIFDAARPLHIQQMMWDSLKMEPKEKARYLAPPGSKSLHNYGCAVDVSVCDRSSKKLLDMGTGFDSFSLLSQPSQEERLLKKGELTEQVLFNRRLLREVMSRAGLHGISTEWWHFSLCRQEEAAARFALIR